MSFAAPTLLLGLSVIPAVIVAYVLHERSRERRAAAWVNPALVPNLVHRPSPRLRHVPAALFLIGLTLLLVGFARPQAKLTTTREGATVVVVIDDSGSMGSADMKPTRLLAADNAVATFLTALPKQYRVSLVVFTDHASVLAPPTYDRKQVAAALPTKALPVGTEVGDAIARAVQVAVAAVGPDRPGAPHPPASILLLSDGASTVKGMSVDDATKLAHKSNVPISTIALGTAGGTVSQGQVLTGGLSQKQSFPVPVDTTTLQSIAQATGGKYSAAPTVAALNQVFKDLGTHAAHTQSNHEVTEIAIGLALLFIIPGVLLSGLWFRRIA